MCSLYLYNAFPENHNFLFEYSSKNETDFVNV